jgi:hypothetical protein
MKDLGQRHRAQQCRSSSSIYYAMTLQICGSEVSADMLLTKSLCYGHLSSKAAAILTTMFDYSMSARYRVRDSEAHKDESKYVEREA